MADHFPLLRGGYRLPWRAFGVSRGHQTTIFQFPVGQAVSQSAARDVVLVHADLSDWRDARGLGAGGGDGGVCRA